LNTLRVALTLALGAAGGWVCWMLTAPLPWMIGAMTVTTLAAVAGLPVRSWRRLRSVMVTILGVLLGSGFTPDLLSQIVAWPVSLLSLFVYCGLSLSLGMAYFWRVAKLDPVTSFFAAAPGGLSEMILIGGQMGGDERAISLLHAVRILLVVFTIPIWFRLFAGYVPAASAAASVGILQAPVIELAKLGACAVLGYALGHFARIPAGDMLGPMILSALAHMTGLTAVRPPVELVSAAQVVLGVAVGCRFAGTTMQELVRPISHGAFFAVLLLGVAVLSSWILHAVTGISTQALTLAYAPGGVMEMSLVALALSIDVAFVATHHAVRLFIVLLLTAPVFRLAQRFWRR
jgi:membrane AbrB-like protein